MGLGDEIMALGRAETAYEINGRPVAICRPGGYARRHDAWQGNPAWDSRWADGEFVRTHHLIDGAALRPYIKHWAGRRIVFNEEHRPRAGRIWLTPQESLFGSSVAQDGVPYAVIAPFVKELASPNKDWGAANWEAVIDGFPMPVYQLFCGHNPQIIRGAIGLRTDTFRKAAAVIGRARLVLCNEGGTHHMAASMRTPAVVFFGSFISPRVTGYDFHRNIAVETEHGFCGNFDRCRHCADAIAQVKPDMVRSQIDLLLGGQDG